MGTYVWAEVAEEVTLLVILRRVDVACEDEGEAMAESARVAPCVESSAWKTRPWIKTKLRLTVLGDWRSGSERCDVVVSE